MKLGGWNVGSERSQREADELADKMRPVMEELASLSAHKAAGELNRRGIKSATGRRLVSGDSLAAARTPRALTSPPSTSPSCRSC